MRRYAIVMIMAALMSFSGTFALAREKVFYFHNDHLGTPQVMTDEAGDRVWEADYEPYGEMAEVRTTIVLLLPRFGIKACYDCQR